MKLSDVVRGSYVGATEVWECSVTRDGVQVAFATGFPDCASARQAAEYLKFGIISGWSAKPRMETGMMLAGMDALSEDRSEIDEEDRLAATALDVFHAMTTVWLTRMVEKISR
ncbi:hypothetical protein [Pandoraea apista]|uniref:hypothetical protein n=1 Tax=Pandoraea apista TaxID=93218 RepID=UPI000B8C46E4|nr:hypothetical protein [Pandoraea apista]OXS92643.1 hypothetical protein B7H01_17035 [Pandoraea apista]